MTYLLVGFGFSVAASLCLSLVTMFSLGTSFIPSTALNFITSKIYLYP